MKKLYLICAIGMHSIVYPCQETYEMVESYLNEALLDLPMKNYEHLTCPSNDSENYWYFSGRIDAYQKILDEMKESNINSQH